MVPAPVLDNLPYNFSSCIHDQLNALADILKIPQHLVQGAGEDEVNAMVATILYRHLDRMERIQAMRDIRAVQSRPLMGKLIDRALQPTHINTSWGLWSLTNDELSAFISSREKIKKYASAIGLGASVLEGKNILNDIFKNKQIKKQHVAILVIWLAVHANNAQLQDAREEFQRRHTINSSRYHGV